jgi:hypothetical protein
MPTGPGLFGAAADGVAAVGCAGIVWLLDRGGDGLCGGKSTSMAKPPPPDIPYEESSL